MTHNGFSGADITEICQRAAKLAIGGAREKEIEARRKAAADPDAMDTEARPDPVPEITKAHFAARR